MPASLQRETENIYRLDVSGILARPSSTARKIG